MPDRAHELTQIGRRLARSEVRVDELKAEAKALVIAAAAEGMSESEIARLVGRNRHTVREWLGKRRR